MATVRIKGIKYDDYGKAQTATSVSPAAVTNLKGLTTDVDGTILTATSGAVAYKIDGFSYTAEKALLVNTGKAPDPGGAEMHKGVMFDKRGFAYLSTLTLDAFP